MTIDDPWNGIEPPEQTGRINARRVALSTPWDLYWAVDTDGNILLLLQHNFRGRRSRRLPKLRGLLVEAQPANGGPNERIIIRLTDREQREVFLRFCQDIVEATALAKTEEQAVERFLARTWRWHRLLRTGRDNRLTDEQQKGLIGELVALERHMLPILGALDAVECWIGPFDEPRDFSVSRIHVEAKARSSSSPRVTISSEHQLEFGSCDTLFLHVTEVSSAAEVSDDAITVSDLAKRVRTVIVEHDMIAVDPYEERLNAAGFDWMDDYSDKLWLLGQESLYKVREGFPRITSAMCPVGVDNLRYTVLLSECETFRVKPNALKAAIVGEINDT